MLFLGLIEEVSHLLLAVLTISQAIAMAGWTDVEMDKVCLAVAGLDAPLHHKGTANHSLSFYSAKLKNKT